MFVTYGWLFQNLFTIVTFVLLLFIFSRTADSWCQVSPLLVKIKMRVSSAYLKLLILQHLNNCNSSTPVFKDFLHDAFAILNKSGNTTHPYRTLVFNLKLFKQVLLISTVVELFLYNCFKNIIRCCKTSIFLLLQFIVFSN